MRVVVEYELEWRYLINVPEKFGRIDLPLSPVQASMQRNVGGSDRIVRGVLGIWLLAVAIAAHFAERRVTAVTAAVAATGLLFNATTRFCGGNYLLGIDTTETASCSRE